MERVHAGLLDFLAADFLVRQITGRIMDRTRALHDTGKSKEVLTVDNHADGPYVYFRMLKEDPKRAAGIDQVVETDARHFQGFDQIEKVRNLGGIALVDGEAQAYLEPFGLTVFHAFQGQFAGTAYATNLKDGTVSLLSAEPPTHTLQ